MSSSQRKAKIRWQCRRGMLELDLIFQRFLKQSLDDLTDEQLSAFESLLEIPDPDLYAALMGYDPLQEKELADFVSFIQHHNHLR
jgi:antitoxin CptB